MTLALSEYAGVWEAKNGSRTIQVRPLPVQNGGEHCFLITNQGSGRKSRMSITALLNDFRKVSAETAAE